MRFMYAMIFVILLVILNPIHGLGQEESDSYEAKAYSAWIIEGAFTIFDPINTFGNNVNGSKNGFSAGVLKQFKPGSDAFVGLSIYYTQLGNDLQENLTASNDPVDDIATSNVLGFDAVFRYYPDLVFSIFEPFAEATIGTRFYYTITKSYFPTFDETLDFRTNEFNSSLAYGFGFGTHLILDDAWAINLKMNYQLANVARYYVENGENNIDPLDNFDLENTSTDWIRYEIGASFIF